jgi:hypothetical protein
MSGRHSTLSTSVARRYRASKGTRASHSVHARRNAMVNELRRLERAAAAPHATPAMKESAAIAVERKAVVDTFTNKQLNDATLHAVVELLEYVAEQEEMTFEDVVTYYQSMFRAGVKGISNAERVRFQHDFAEDVMNVILRYQRLGQIASTKAARDKIRELFDYGRTSGPNGVARVRGVLEADFKHIKRRVNARGGKRRSVRHRKTVCRKTQRRA